jgi:hypothetical protein
LNLLRYPNGIHSLSLVKLTRVSAEADLAPPPLAKFHVIEFFSLRSNVTKKTLLVTFLASELSYLVKSLLVKNYLILNCFIIIIDAGKNALSEEHKLGVPGSLYWSETCPGAKPLNT